MSGRSPLPLPPSLILVAAIVAYTTFAVQSSLLSHPRRSVRRTKMLLEDKVAVIYGAGGAIGGAVARTFAREGAMVYLSGRNLRSVNVVTTDIIAAGGMAEVAEVDALDENAVEAYLAAIVGKSGKIDGSFNAITPGPQPGIQGLPIAELPVDSFLAPISGYMRSHFLTARAAARRMAEKGSGVLLMHTPEPARLGAPFVGGMGPAWAAMEAFNRNLSA